MKQSSPAPCWLPEPRLCVPVHGLWLRLQNKQGKSQKAPFALQQPFFSRPHRYVLVSHPLLAPLWVRGFLNKKIRTNFLLEGVPPGRGWRKRRLLPRPIAAGEAGQHLLQSPKLRGGHSTRRGKKKNKNK